MTPRKTIRYTLMTVVLLTALAAFIPANAQERETMSTTEGWREDPERLREGTRFQPDADTYMRLLAESGMTDHLSTTGPTAFATGAGWSSVGPKGGFGAERRNGRINDFDLKQGPSGLILTVGSCQGGVWRTLEPSWTQWADMSLTLPNPSVGSLSVHPTSFDDIVVGTGVMNRYTGAGIFRTTNAGLTWTRATVPGSTPDYVLRIIRQDASLAPVNMRLIAATSEGLLRSTDGGNTFVYATNMAGINLTGLWTDIVENPLDPNVLYACRADSGIYRSDDAGLKWRLLSDSVLPAAASWYRSSLAIAASDTGTIAVMNTPFADLQGVYRSTNGGADWSDITHNLVKPDYIFGKGQAFHVMALAIRPNDAQDITAGIVGLARKVGSDTTWTLNPFPSGHADFARLRFESLTGPDILWMCNDGGIYKHDFSTGITTDLLGNNFSGLACTEVDFMDADRGAFAFGAQDNGVAVSSDGGMSWEEVATGDGGDVELVVPETGEMLFSSGIFANNIWNTFRWTPGVGKTQTALQFAGPMTFAWSPDEDITYGHDETSVYFLDPAPDTVWGPVMNNFQVDPYIIKAVKASRAGDRTLWITYRSGNELDLTVVRNTSGFWTIDHQEGFCVTSGSVNHITPSHEWPGEAWVACSGIIQHGGDRILHTTDWGATWEDISGNLGSVNVNQVAYLPFDPATLYAATDLGMYVTTNGGDTWTPFQDSLPIGRCKEIRFVLDDAFTNQHKLVLATDGRGFWTRTITAPPVVFVDKDNTSGVEDGTREHPWNTVTEGVASAPVGAIVAIRTNTYLEPQFIGKDVRLVTWSGTSIID